MNIVELKRYMLVVVITATVIISALALTKKNFLPSWHNCTTYLTQFVSKSPIVLINADEHPMLVDIRDIYMTEDIESASQSGISEVLKKLVRKSDKALIVGDGVGYYSILIGEIIGNKGKLFVFQPNEDTRSLLEYNLKINNIWSYTVLSDKMPYSTNSTVLIEKVANSLESYKVLLRKEDISEYARLTKHIESVRVDDFLKGQNLSLIKLNCYGAEIQTLIGALNVIQNSPRLSIMMPWYPSRMKYYGDIMSFINNMTYLGFEFWSISESGSKALLNKSRLLKENFNNIVITREMI